MGKPNYDTVMQARELYEEARRVYLESHGWRATSDTPGCFWLWTKLFKGRRILVDVDLAAEMQRFYGSDSWPFAPDQYGSAEFLLGECETWSKDLPERASLLTAMQHGYALGEQISMEEERASSPAQAQDTDAAPQEAKEDPHRLPEWFRALAMHLPPGRRHDASARMLKVMEDLEGHLP